MITKVNFGKRISDLRIGGGQNSAREMSLALGQNPSYINRIENGKALPSMQGFFSICEYLQITPGDFFNEDSEAPGKCGSYWRRLRCLHLNRGL